MLTLELTSAPRWYDLAPSLRVQMHPLTTSPMVTTRSDPAVEATPDETTDEQRAVAFAKAPARRATLAPRDVLRASSSPWEIWPWTLCAGAPGDVRMGPRHSRGGGG